MNASLKLELPGIITNLMLRSISETLSDGTVTFHVSKVKMNVYQLLWIEQVSTSNRDTKTEIIYNGKGENYDWSVIVKKGSKPTVRFTLNDYTVPSAAEAKREEVKQVAGITPIIHLKREQRDYPDGTVYCTYISWGDYGRISVYINESSKHATFYCDANVGINNWERFSKAQQIALRIIKVWEARWAA